MENPPPRASPSEIEKCQNWVKHLIDLLGDDGYDDCYLASCQESYTIPGDIEWFSFKFPTRQPDLGSILFELRPELRKRFQEDMHLSKETVLEKTKYDTPKYMYRTSALFVLNVIDTHMRNMGIQWKNAILVEQEGIELSLWKLSRAMCPVLLQVFSRYVIYNDLHYMVCDNIYEAIVLWFKLLKTEYGDHLFGRDIKHVVDEIIPD